MDDRMAGPRTRQVTLPGLPATSSRRQQRRAVERAYLEQTGRRMSGRQWVRWRKDVQRTARKLNGPATMAVNVARLLP